MFEVAVQILTNIFGKMLNFIFGLEFAPGVSIGTIFLFIGILSITLFIIFGAINNKKG